MFNDTMGFSYSEAKCSIEVKSCVREIKRERGRERKRERERERDREGGGRKLTNLWTEDRKSVV